MTALWCDWVSSIHYWIMADFVMPEAQQPITVIILIIYSPYLLKDLVKVSKYISGRIATSSSGL